MLTSRGVASASFGKNLAATGPRGGLTAAGGLALLLAGILVRLSVHAEKREREAEEW